ncbi:MAG TPA: zf-HC2 domain-containing protein, partial [Polyangiaceae bacterium]|nr:zf-HC2 domain-containing protein [Polyangiaceae bacterium]
MSVAELHPEELFDKLVEGGLSDSERDRLVSHLQGCAVCRFDYAARLDFEQEAVVTEQRVTPHVPLRPLRSPAPTVARRRPPRIMVWGIAAAVMICGSAALAALGERPWRALSAIFVSESPAPSPTRGPTAVRPASKAVPQPAEPAEEPVVSGVAALTPAAQAAVVAATTHHARSASVPSTAVGSKLGVKASLSASESSG